MVWLAMATASGVSVIIPSYEAWRSLHRTLSATVHDCRTLGEPWEVLVVDNESGNDFQARAESFVAANSGVRLIRRFGLQGRNFQPGAARNIGIDEARYESLIFLDADCVPAQKLISTYHWWTRQHHDVIFIGHREFIDPTGVDPNVVANCRAALAGLERVQSTSNYGSRVERRMPELKALAEHPRPYDCMYACNMAMHRDCLGDNRFATVFDGFWGYEDIELGYRLHKAGRSFQYLAAASVFHQEGASLSAMDRATGRAKNFAIAGEMIEGFVRYRYSIQRLGAAPVTGILPVPKS